MTEQRTMYSFVLLEFFSITASTKKIMWLFFNNYRRNIQSLLWDHLWCKVLFYNCVCLLVVLFLFLFVCLFVCFCLFLLFFVVFCFCFCFVFCFFVLFFSFISENYVRVCFWFVSWFSFWQYFVFDIWMNNS